MKKLFRWIVLVALLACGSMALPVAATNNSCTDNLTDDLKSCDANFEPGSKSHGECVKAAGKKFDACQNKQNAPKKTPQPKASKKP